MDKDEIIRRISFLRTRANLSARALSNMIGLNDGYINRLESKKDFLPRLDVLLDIISACNSSTEEFFYKSIPAYKQDMQILQLLEDVSPEKKDAIIALIKK